MQQLETKPQKAVKSSEGEIDVIDKYPAMRSNTVLRLDSMYSER